MPGATPYYSKAKDVFIQRRTANGRFEEWGISVTPNSFIMCDDCNNLVAVSSESLTVISASYALTASFALNGGGGTFDDSHLVTTASFNEWTGSSESQFSGTASFAISASWAPSSGGPSGDDEKVKISATDTTTDYLEAKIQAGPNIYISKSIDGGYERLHFSSSAVGGGDFDDSHLVTTTSFNEWTGSSDSYFYGTSSFAISASWAPSEEFDDSHLVTTTSFNDWTGSTESQFAGTASYVESSSYSYSGSYALSASWAPSAGGSGGDDEKVKISATDTTTDYLANKISSGSRIDLEIITPGGYEELNIKTRFQSLYSTRSINVSSELLLNHDFSSGSGDIIYAWEHDTAEWVWYEDYSEAWYRGTNQTPLSQSVDIVSGSVYRVQWSIWGPAYITDSASVYLGNQYIANMNSSTGLIEFTAQETGLLDLSIQPSADFQVDLEEISLKQVIYSSYTDSAIDILNDLGEVSYVLKGLRNNIAIGNNTLDNVSTGTNNIALGNSALSNLTTGTSNFVLGNSASLNLTTGTRNTAIGENSLLNLTTGYDNIAIGRNSLPDLTTGGSTSGGHSNVAIGNSSLSNGTAARENVAIGHNVMTGSGNARFCVAVGFEALTRNSADFNTAIGNKALYTSSVNNTYGSNVAVGYFALYKGVSARRNVAVGYGAMANTTNNSTGSGNVAIGYSALSKFTAPVGIATTTYLGNIAIGYQALEGTTRTGGGYPTSMRNIAIGENAIHKNFSARNCIAIGRDTLGGNAETSETPGNYGVECSQTIAIGNLACQKLRYDIVENGQWGNVFIGTAAGFTAFSATDTIAIGMSASYFSSSPFHNICIGNNVMAGDAQGHPAGNGSPNWCIAIGHEAMRHVGAVHRYCIAIGSHAHKNIKYSAEGNVTIGDYTISTSETSFTSFNSIVGHRALSASYVSDRNAVLGAFAAGDTTSGFQACVFIGNEAARYYSGSPITASMAIGAFSTITKSKEVVFGGTTTDYRTELIRPNVDNVCDLGSGSFKWKDIYFSGTAYGTSSWAVSASWAPSTGGGGASLETGSTYPITSSWAESASWAPSTGGTSLGTGSTYPITSSWSVTASYAENVKWLATGSTYPITSSWAVSSSYAPIPKIKAGIVSGSSFGGATDLTASVAFDLPFVNNIYSVTVTGEDPRTWYVEFKDENGFIINSNSNVAFSGNVYWHAIYMGEY